MLDLIKSFIVISEFFVVFLAWMHCSATAKACESTRLCCILILFFRWFFGAVFSIIRLKKVFIDQAKKRWYFKSSMINESKNLPSSYETCEILLSLFNERTWLREVKKRLIRVMSNNNAVVPVFKSPSFDKRLNLKEFPRISPFWWIFRGFIYVIKIQLNSLCLLSFNKSTIYVCTFAVEQ